jgi:hypothetical protein
VTFSYQGSTTLFMQDLRPLSVSVSKLTSDAFARKFVALGRILSHWESIVGSDMSSKAQPVKLHYRKPKTRGEKPQASLDIGANSADAALLHYQKDLILERLNQIFGDNWITSIRFVHVAANSSADDWNGYKAKKNAPLSSEEQQRIAPALEAIEDEDLRKILEKLGQGILRKKGADKI